MVFIGSLKKNVDVHHYYKRCLNLEKKDGIVQGDLLYCNMAYAQLMEGQTDSAQWYTTLAKTKLDTGNLNPHAAYRLEILQATIHFQRGEFEQESLCMERAKKISLENGYIACCLCY